MPPQKLEGTGFLQLPSLPHTYPPTPGPCASRRHSWCLTYPGRAGGRWSAKGTAEEVKGRFSPRHHPQTPEGCPAHQPAADLVPEDLELHQPQAGAAILLGAQGQGEIGEQRGGGAEQAQGGRSEQILASLGERKRFSQAMPSFFFHLPLSILLHKQNQSSPAQGKARCLNQPWCHSPGNLATRCLQGAQGKNRLVCKRDATGHGWGRARSHFSEPVAPRSHPWSTLGAATRTPSPFPQPPSPGTAGQPSPSSHGEVSQAPGCLPGKLSPARGAKRIHPSG